MEATFSDGIKKLKAALAPERRKERPDSNAGWSSFVLV
jgi:hypothetical protein